MRILAIESSSPWLSLAVLDGDVIHERRGTPGVTHSEEVLACLNAVLADAGIGPRALDAIAFGAGPGGFTGVRLACAMAQGMAMGLDLPVVSVVSLEAMAAATGAARVLACVDARMGEVYCAAYERDAAGMRTVLEPCVVAPGQVPCPDGDGWHVCGSAVAAYGDILLPRLSGLAAGFDPQAVPTAAWVARLGSIALAAGAGTPAAQAAPRYVRDRVALTTAERLAAGGKA